MASRVLEKPQVSVWMFLFPLVLIPFMQRVQRHKELLNLFTQGYLFTKKLALDAAFKLKNEDKSKSEAVSEATEMINHHTTAPEQNEKHEKEKYKQKLRKHQIEEIDILVEHYSLLLSAQGESYWALVACAYNHDEKEYTFFLRRLEEAEKQVNQASIKVYGDEVENLTDIITNMEQALSTLRAEESSQIFGSGATG